MYRFEIGSYVERLIDWMTIHWAGFFGGIREGLSAIIDGFSWLFLVIPFVVFILVVVLLAWRISGKGVAIFAGIGLLLIRSMNLWSETMYTLSMITTATLIALIIGIPLGIWMSHSNKANQIIRPILDFMQTMPAFVYLIPAVYFFDLGEVPGTVATVIFAMPPVVRLTNLGIRQVPRDVIEASRAFGATSKQRLFKVEIPLAMPTILAGLNQTIMLSLSMVVISSMIGAKGLGIPVLNGITQLKVGEGFEGGLAVVVLAMILDRITQGLGRFQERKNAHKKITG
ncbi:proline/glycine betaine ABC transporter permease [Oscillibacter sp.]|uniref:ABC transporter permease n=1 Tax=Oscillibacter sp. TaxID=1945593 RepID=UPI0028AE5ABA|nr:proline/glycine betaine ABC transporter permease [Oscillibacter sp.]